MPSITDSQRQAVLTLHSQGKARNEIARELGISAGSVTAIVKAAGRTFNRTATKDATEARKRDLAKMRADLEFDLLRDAATLRQRIWNPREYAQAVGGMDPRVMHWTMDEPTPPDQLKLMQAAGAAIDRSLKIAQASREDGAEQGKSLLGSLFEKLQVQAGEAPEPGEQP